MSPAAFIAMVVFGFAPLGPEMALNGAALRSPTGSTHIVRDARRADRATRPALSPCDAVIDRLCDEGGPAVCSVIERELKDRKFTERDQRQCREMLSNPNKFNEVLELMRRRAARP